ncbi:hypothetical protein D9M73_165640 [compost metagenome]
MHCGERNVEKQADQQVVDHRQEQVIQQQRPAGQEADIGAEGHVGVGIGRTRDREALDHEAVGRGGEQHGHQGDDIGAGRAATSKFGDDAVSGEEGQRDHVHQAEEHQGGQAEDTAELDGGGAGCVGHRSIQSVFVVVLWSIFIHLGGGRQKSNPYADY